MTENPQPVVTLNFDDGGGEHNFFTLQDAIAWIDHELSAWQVLGQLPTNIGATGNPTALSFVQNQLNAIRNKTRTFVDNQIIWGTTFKQLCDDAYASRRNLIHSKSRLGAFILALSNENKEEAAWATLFFSQREFSVRVGNQAFQVLPLDLLSASFKVIASLQGYHASSTEAAALGLLHEEWNTRLVENIDKFTEQANLASNNNSIALTEIEKRRQEFLAMAEKHQSTIDNHLQMMTEIENKFAHQMALRAPIDYWKTRETGFRKLEKMWGWASFWTMLASIIILPILAFCFTQLSKANSDLLLRADVKDASFVAMFAQETLPGIVRFGSVAALVAWTLRILIRNYLSASHLATDASERSMLIQTYMSLLNVPELQNSPKFLEQIQPIALQNVFRHSADGMVRDDAMPYGLTDIMKGKPPA